MTRQPTPLDKLEYCKLLKPMLVPDIIAGVAGLLLEKRYLTLKQYAEYYGFHPKTIAQWTESLRSKGAVIFEGKLTRYDKMVRPDGEPLYGKQIQELLAKT